MCWQCARCIWWDSRSSLFKKWWNVRKEFDMRLAWERDHFKSRKKRCSFHLKVKHLRLLGLRTLMWWPLNYNGRVKRAAIRRLSRTQLCRAMRVCPLLMTGKQLTIIITLYSGHRRVTLERLWETMGTAATESDRNYGRRFLPTISTEVWRAWLASSVAQKIKSVVV